MKFDALENFIKKKMRMTHIYQPIMIKTLLASNNTATIEEIARAFVNSDPSQLEYYKKITRRWPHITLKSHSVISYDRGVYTLLVDGIGKKQRQKLIELCDLRLQEFIDGDPNIKLAHETDKKPITGTLRFDVLAKSKGICMACGLKASNGYYLHVDHIVPRSLGGRTELDNLQPLCYKCNTEKRNRDDTNFIKWNKRLESRIDKCKLCHPADTVRENNMAYAVSTSGTVTQIAPKRHVGEFVDLIPSERHLCLELVDYVQSNAKKRNGAVKFEVIFDSKDRSPEKHYSIILRQKQNAPMHVPKPTH